MPFPVYTGRKIVTEILLVGSRLFALKHSELNHFVCISTSIVPLKSLILLNRQKTFRIDLHRHISASAHSAFSSFWYLPSSPPPVNLDENKASISALQQFDLLLDLPCHVLMASATMSGCHHVWMPGVSLRPLRWMQSFWLGHFQNLLAKLNSHASVVS